MVTYFITFQGWSGYILPIALTSLCFCIVLKGASHHSHSAIALLAEIGLLVPLFWVLAVLVANPEINICGAHRRSSPWTLLTWLEQCMDFAKRTLENIPPKQGALLRPSIDTHCIRQDIFGERLLKGRKIYIPSEWSWVLDEQLFVVRAVHCSNTATLQAIIVKKHKGNCKCANANLGCTHLCHCECGCINNVCPKTVC